MGYKVGTSTEVIDDDANVELTTLTVETSLQSIEISSAFTGPFVVGEDNGFGIFNQSGGPGVPTGYFIQKFPFSISSGNATDVGDLSRATSDYGSGHTENTYGFHAGGNLPATQIDKFPFSISSGTSTDVGDLNIPGATHCGSSSETDGFAHGGPASSPFVYNIDKFPFSISSGTATDVGDIAPIILNGTGHSSPTTGYISGGHFPTIPAPFDVYNSADTFQIAISRAASSNTVGLSARRKYDSGNDSETHAYETGGQGSGSAQVSSSERFPLSASPATSASIGNLYGSPQTVERQTSNSSRTNGFLYAGTSPSAFGQIDKFPFSASSGVTIVDTGAHLTALNPPSYAFSNSPAGVGIND